MPITLTCRCKASLSVPDKLVGSTTMCPECGEFIDVPEPEKEKKKSKNEEKYVVLDHEPEELTKRDLKKLVREALEGAIRPVRRTAGYHLGVVCVGIAMLALPLLYICLILFVALLVYLHATTNAALFGTMRIYVALIFYICPLLAGLIALAFMIKPLLARPPRARRGKLVRSDQEPILTMLVEDIAWAVNAPKPKRIEVDCQVNASAGFGSGLSGLFGNQLTLTIGLPLVEGLTAKQFAGVLAHEFGHFSQGAAMRFSFIIRSINAWFARVVFERDSWDEKMREWCEESDLACLIAIFVRIGVAANRAVLWVFMMIGHLLSSFLLRRMEFDADRSEVRLVGVKAFEKTFRRIAIMNAAAVEAIEIVQGCWIKDRFPDDFAALVVGLADTMSSKERRRVEEEMEDTHTGILDSHPSFEDRMTNVESEEGRGVFHIDLPASALFRTLPKLAPAASLELYKGIFGRGIQPTLRPTEDYLSGRVS